MKAHALACCVLIAAVGGCQTVAEDASTSAPTVASAPAVVSTPTPAPTLKVRSETVLPGSFSRALREAPGEARAAVPEGMIAISEVVRPRAEVRMGPGTQFELTDLVLPQGARVIVFQQVGVWRHVLAPARWQRGWVHHQALSQAELNRREVIVDMTKLPTVLALQPVEQAIGFPALEPLAVAVPKGAMFRALTMNDTHALVWVAETNSVMWISRKDVQ